MAFKPNYRNREEKPPEAPKPKRAITATVPVIREVIATIRKEFPWYLDNEANLSKIFDCLQECNAAAFDLQCVRPVVELLEARKVLDHVPPPPAPAPPPLPEPFDYAALTDTDELPLDTPEWRLKKSTTVQLHDLVKRQQAAQKK